MGVMGCSRPECENIMCGTYVGNSGYVCYECKEEFLNFLESQGISPDALTLTEFEIRDKLEEFMKTSKGSQSADQEVISVNYFFDKHTR